MPTFLSDPPTSVYLLLALLVFVTGGVWFNRRDRKSLMIFGGALGILAVVVLIDIMFESPREEAVRRLQAMMKAADAGDREGFVANVADTVQYQGASPAVTISRDQLRKAGFWNILKQYDVHVAAWDFARSDAAEIDANTVEIGFLAKGENRGDPKPFVVYFRATFARQPDGQMKLTKLASFDPLKRQNERMTLPNVP